jgi:hypothetical protein
MRLVLSSVFYLLFGALAAAASQPLALTVAADKDSYIQQEPIGLTVALINRSTDSVVINKRMSYPGPDLVIQITDPRGSLLRWNAPAPPPALAQSDFIRLDPGQQYRLQLSDISRHLFDRFSIAGEYRVRAIYENREAGGQWHHRAWIGTVQSPAITFRWGG